MHAAALFFLVTTANAGMEGYYRSPAIHGDTLVFTAEGDLWKVGTEGGDAIRLTSHAEGEMRTVFSPDGSQIAFAASYEGPVEVYSMPIDGGLPKRRTWLGTSAVPRDWTEAGIVFSTQAFSGLPDNQLAIIGDDDKVVRVPLAQADDVAYDGANLYFTRLAHQGSFTKRYLGGTAQNLWHFDGTGEATPLTADYAGTSADPMFWDGRVYFASDRDGVMNLWSMKPDGSDTQQHTEHDVFSVQSPSLQGGKVVYQHAADIWLHDLEKGSGAKIDIRLTSDLDQTREQWVDHPMQYLTSASPSPTGDRAVLTARGQIFVAQTEHGGRFIEITRNPGVRYREARFLDEKTLIAMSDESGELEFWTVPADGMGQPKQLTKDGKIFRHNAVLSPTKDKLAYTDRDAKLWILNVKTGASTLVVEGMDFPYEMKWSGDGQWLAYVNNASNGYSQVWIHRVSDGKSVAVTSDRIYSSSPAWSPDGKWLYFVGERALSNQTGSPWGPWQPEPTVDNTTLIYAVSLNEGELWPWSKRNELQDEKPAVDEDEEEKEDKKRKKPKKKRRNAEVEAAPALKIDLDGLQHRLYRVPVPAGNIGGLELFDDKLLYRVWNRGSGVVLRGVKINDDETPEVKDIVQGIGTFEVSADRKQMLIGKDWQLYAVDVGLNVPDDLSSARVRTEGWRFPFDPREEWKQILVEAWRLERDYFYDRDMHGNDWPAILERYLPLVDRVTNRGELNDVIAQMVAELSALHTFVFGGDHREVGGDVGIASLGARLVRVDNGYKVGHIFETDPEYPEALAPLAQVEVNVRVGDVITHVNSVATTSVPNIAALLRGKAWQQVRLTVKSGSKTRDVIVEPMSVWAEADLRYREWEYTRRLEVEEKGNSEIGYLHLRAMGGGDYNTWLREYYPVFKRQGLIIDVRHNRGGNIDAWLLEKLLRKAWMFWQGRTGEPDWNMHYAFLGHVVVLCDAATASDGEAFTDGFMRLDLGHTIGTRTWGGEIWLSFQTWLKDRGIATAAETGVYGPEGEWLIEGHGVDPDQVVDNLPNATFNGSDAQLEAAIAYLNDKIAKEPVVVPKRPAYPDKSLDAFRKRAK